MVESQDASIGVTLPTNSVRIPIPRQHSLFDSLFGVPGDKNAPEIKTPKDEGNLVHELTNQLNIQHNFKLATTDAGNPVKELTNQLNIQHNFKELKDQFLSLQAVVSEHNIEHNFKELKDQFHSLQSLVSQQNDKITLLQNEVSEIAMAMTAKDAVAKKDEVALASQDKCQSNITAIPLVLPLQDANGRGTAPESPHSQSDKNLLHVASNLLVSLKDVPSPSRRQRQVITQSLKDVPSPSRCQRQVSSQSLKSWLSSTSSRSASPEKIQVEFKNTQENPPRRSNSPDSPTSRLEARLAPKLLSNLNNFVDAQIQNLELRVLGVEKICASWRQAVVLDGVVEGVSSADLHMLSGLAVVADGSDKQSESCAESVSRIPSISASSVSTTEASQTFPCSNAKPATQAKLPYKKSASRTKSKSLYDDVKETLHAPWISPRKSVRLSSSQNEPSKEATFPWKRFFGRPRGRV